MWAIVHAESGEPRFCSLAPQCKRRMSEARSRFAAKLECEPHKVVAITAPAASGDPELSVAQPTP
jgi:hypothetical protein